MMFDYNQQKKRGDNNQPQPILEVHPYNAVALSDCRSVLEEVVAGACVLASTDGS
jgi:hypothetical protein